MHLAGCLKTNVGLSSLELLGHRINSEVAAAFVDMFQTNMTLCKLIWKLEVGGYNLKFTEITNRNTEIDRWVRDGNDCAPPSAYTCAHRSRFACRACAPASCARPDSPPHSASPLYVPARVVHMHADLEHLPRELRESPPQLVPRIVPDPDNEVRHLFLLPLVCPLFLLPLVCRLFTQPSTPPSPL